MSDPPHEERSRRPRSRLTARVRRDVLVDRTAFGLVSRFAARRPDPDDERHHGQRSQGAAEHFRLRGHRRVYNVVGGIDAWSERVDSSVPRY